MVIGIEAKANDPSGQTVRKALLAVEKRLVENSRSKGVERLRGLATTFGLDLDRPGIGELRYQLLTLTAATVAEACRQSAQRAVVIVHEFVTVGMGLPAGQRQTAFRLPDRRAQKLATLARTAPPQRPLLPGPESFARN